MSNNYSGNVPFNIYTCDGKQQETYKTGWPKKIISLHITVGIHTFVNTIGWFSCSNVLVIRNYLRHIKSIYQQWSAETSRLPKYIVFNKLHANHKTWSTWRIMKVPSLMWCWSTDWPVLRKLNVDNVELKMMSQNYQYDIDKHFENWTDYRFEKLQTIPALMETSSQV